MKKKHYFIALLLVLIDQIIKCVVSNSIDLNTSIKIIPNFFYITNVHNYGAAFGILDGGKFFLISIGIIAILTMYYFSKSCKNKYEIFSSVLLLSGIIGNLLDRILLGYVVDYLDFYIFSYNYPVFNFADICIVVGALLIIFLELKEQFK